jgi:soluble lytic murein transglycosylase-like protein
MSAALTIAVVGIGAGALLYRRGTATGETLEGMLRRVSVAHGADPRLVAATAATESNWSTKAVNLTDPGDVRRGGAWGLCQLTAQTAREVDARNGGEWRARGGELEQLLDPELNVALASHLIREESARAAAAGFPYGSETHAANVASAYNSGRLLKDAPASTRDTHVPRFLRNWRALGGVA